MKIYRVYAEEKITKIYEQDVIASSKDEAITLADESEVYHKWVESDDIEGESGDLEQTHMIVVLQEDDEKNSHQWDELMRRRDEEEEK